MHVCLFNDCVVCVAVGMLGGVIDGTSRLHTLAIFGGLDLGATWNVWAGVVPTHACREMRRLGFTGTAFGQASPMASSMTGIASSKAL